MKPETTMKHETTLDKIRHRLSERAAGFHARSKVLFNGAIITEELRSILRDMEKWEEESGYGKQD